MSRPSSAERLERLLAIVPWVVAQDGPTVSETCARFGISERDLIADLNLLFMCGVYPYTPDSLIEVDIDGGRVWVRFADWFRRPLRLTPPEGLALVAAARALLGVPAPAVPITRAGWPVLFPNWRWSSERGARRRSKSNWARPRVMCCVRSRWGERAAQSACRLLLVWPGRGRGAGSAALAAVFFGRPLVPVGVV